MDGVQLHQGKSNFEEAVYFLPLSSQKFLILILSTSEGWKAESTLVPPGGFEHGTPGSEIHRLNQFVDELLEYGAERVKSRPVLILNLFQIHGPLAYLLKTSDGTSGLGKKKMQAMWLSHVTHKISRSSHQRCSMEKYVLRNFTKFTGKHCTRASFLIKLQACNFMKKEALAQIFKACNFIKKEALAQMFSWFFLNIEIGEKKTKFDF